MFYDRDEQGAPHDWCQCMKRSPITNTARFGATRMMLDSLSGALHDPLGVRDRMTATGIRADPHSLGRLPSRTA